MEMKMKRLALLLIFIFATSATIEAVAQKNSGAAGRNGLLNFPGLTQEQKEKIRSIQLEHAREAMTLRTRIAEKNAALNTELAQKNPDQKEVARRLEDLYDLKLQLEQNRVNNLLNVRGQLNDEQKLQFDLRRQARENLLKANKRPGHQYRPGARQWRGPGQNYRGMWPGRSRN